MEITISLELNGTLSRLAEDRGMSTQDYVQNYVHSHLLSQYKQSIVEKIVGETLTNLVELETVVVNKKGEFSPVVIPVIPYKG